MLIALVSVASGAAGGDICARIVGPSVQHGIAAIIRAAWLGRQHAAAQAGAIAAVATTNASIRKIPRRITSRRTIDGRIGIPTATDV